MKAIGSHPARRHGGFFKPARLLPILPAVAALLLVPSAALAQAGRDFLFRTPALDVTLRTGYNMARAGGDVFDFTRENLTLDRADFGGFMIGGDFAVHVTPQFDVVLGFSHASTSARSEFKEWVDQDDLPIEQRTRFSQTPLTVGVRYSLVPRGRQVGRFVWIPARVVPYVGASVGGVWYSFVQDGDWVDFQDLGIFYDELESRGWTAVGQAFGGVQFSVTPRMALVAEGRLSVANAEPGRDFVGFDGIDLSGLQFTVGLSFRL